MTEVIENLEVCVVVPYAPLKKNGVYKVVDEGRDWYSVKCHGKLVYVPKDYVGEPKIEEYEEELEEWEGDFE